MSDLNNTPSPAQITSILSITPISYQWLPVNSVENVPYSFPNGLTTYMKSKYGFPALYRWVIRKSDGSILYYLGETDGLVPRRIYQYLNPGPSQKTNQRLHEEFHREFRNSSKIQLEYLAFSPFTINNKAISQSSLQDSHVRKALEELFTVLSLTNGERLLNK